MISTLLMPFMCLSLSEGANGTESRTKTFNEITSISDAGYKDDAAYKDYNDIKPLIKEQLK